MDDSRILWQMVVFLIDMNITSGNFGLQAGIGEPDPQDGGDGGGCFGRPGDEQGVAVSGQGFEVWRDLCDLLHLRCEYFLDAMEEIW